MHFRSLYMRLQGFTKKHPVFCLALAAGVAYIVFTVGLGVYTQHVIPANSAATANYPYETNLFLNSFAKWDSRFYLSIAKYGYLESVHAAFFPLYPLLSSLFTYPTGSYLLGGILVSWASLLAALYYYLKVSAKLLNLKKLEEYVLALCLFLFFPTAVFSVGVYTESLFAALVLGALYYGLVKRPLLSASLAGLACVTRLNGVFVLLFLLLLLIEKGYTWRKVAGYGMLSLLPLLLYMAFLYKEFHNPLQFLVAEKAWDRFGGAYISTISSTITLVSMAGFLLALTALAYYVRRRHWSFVLYMGLYMITPLASGNFDGFSRYILMAFPLHWMMTDVLRKRRLLQMPVMAVYASLWCYYLIQFVGGYTGG